MRFPPYRAQMLSLITNISSSDLSQLRSYHEYVRNTNDILMAYFIRHVNLIPFLSQFGYIVCFKRKMKAPLRCISLLDEENIESLLL